MRFFVGVSFWGLEESDGQKLYQGVLPGITWFIVQDHHICSYKIFSWDLYMGFYRFFAIIRCISQISPFAISLFIVTGLLLIAH